MPSELKMLWEEICEKMIDCFIDFVDDKLSLHHLISLLVKKTVQTGKQYLESTVSRLNEVLRTSESQFTLLFRQYFKSVFTSEDDLERRVNNTIQCFTAEAGKSEEISELTSSIYLRKLVKSLDLLYFHCYFHEPQLNFRPEEGQTYREFKQSELFLLDGFPSEGVKCLVLLKPPLLYNNYPFKDLKSLSIITEEKEIKKKLTKTPRIKRERLKKLKGAKMLLGAKERKIISKSAQKRVKTDVQSRVNRVSYESVHSDNSPTKKRSRKSAEKIKKSSGGYIATYCETTLKGEYKPVTRGNSKKKKNQLRTTFRKTDKMYRLTTEIQGGEREKTIVSRKKSKKNHL